MKKTLKYLAWACVVAALAAPVALADEDKAVNDDAAVARSLDIFNTLYKELNTFYVDTIDAQKSIENAINAMLDDIDPYTEYIPAKEAEEFMTISTGEYGGIGSYLMERTIDGKKGVYISGPYEGSPAARAGVRSGDRIIMIDGDSTAGWASDHVFGSRTHRTCVFCFFGIALAVAGFWAVPTSAPLAAKLIPFAMIGFFVYGPQALLGISSTQQATPRAAAAAGGILGILGYLSTIVSGVGFGWMAQNWGWNAAYATILVAAIAGGLVVLMMWKAPAEQTSEARG